MKPPKQTFFLLFCRSGFRFVYIFSYNLLQFCGHSWILANNIMRFLRFGRGKVKVHVTIPTSCRENKNSGQYVAVKIEGPWKVSHLCDKSSCLMLHRCLSRHISLYRACDESVPAAFHPGALPHCRWDWESQTPSSLHPSVCGSSTSGWPEMDQ